MLPKDSQEVQAILKRQFPDCTAMIVEGAGHFVHADKPSQVMQFISEFLNVVDAKSD